MHLSIYLMELASYIGAEMAMDRAGEPPIFIIIIYLFCKDKTLLLYPSLGRVT